MGGGNGNGDSRLPSLRFLGRTLWRRPPRGPFTGKDAARALEAEGWELVSGPPNEWRTYRHSEKPGLATINVEWTAFYEEDATFQILCGRMEISASRLLGLLERSR